MQRRAVVRFPRVGREPLAGVTVGRRTRAGADVDDAVSRRRRDVHVQGAPVAAGARQVSHHGLPDELFARHARGRARPLETITDPRTSADRSSRRRVRAAAASAHSIAIGIGPVTTGADPRTTGAAPVAPNGDAAMTDNDPQTIRTYPGTTGAAPVATRTVPVTADAGPVTTRAAPVATFGYPVDSCVRAKRPLADPIPHACPRRKRRWPSSEQWRTMLHRHGVHRFRARSCFTHARSSATHSRSCSAHSGGCAAQRGSCVARCPAPRERRGATAACRGRTATR